MRGEEGSLKQGPLYVTYPKFLGVPLERFKFKFRSAARPWVPKVPKAICYGFQYWGGGFVFLPFEQQ